MFSCRGSWITTLLTQISVFFDATDEWKGIKKCCTAISFFKPFWWVCTEKIKWFLHILSSNLVVLQTNRHPLYTNGHIFFLGVPNGAQGVLRGGRGHSGKNNCKMCNMHNLCKRLLKWLILPHIEIIYPECCNTYHL